MESRLLFKHQVANQLRVLLTSNLLKCGAVFWGGPEFDFRIAGPRLTVGGCPLLPVT
jgi:hypothetical protein